MPITPITASKPSSDNPQTQAPQNVQYAAPYPRQFEDDTIDLYELCITLWNKKGLVIAVTVIAALGSVVYALQQQPVYVYKTKALLLPPKEKDVQLLNVQGVKKNKVADVFTTFKNNLSSFSVQMKFIEKKGMMDILAPEQDQEKSEEEIRHIFANMSIISEKLDNKLSRISISTKFNDPNNSAKWLNAYIDFSESETIRELVEEIRKIIQNKTKVINQEIIHFRDASKNWREYVRAESKKKRANLRDESKKKRANLRDESKKKRANHLLNIIKYEEAIQIATRLGIKDGDEGDCSSNNFRDPNYCLGYRVLNVELEFFKKRKFIDPNIIDPNIIDPNIIDPNIIDPNIFKISELEQKIALLQNIKIEGERVRAVIIYQAAYLSKVVHSKTNRRRIVSISTVVGLFLGIFLVFIVSWVQKQKEIRSK